MLPVKKKKYVKKYFTPEHPEIIEFMIKGLYSKDWITLSRDLGREVMMMTIKNDRPLSEVKDKIFEVAKLLKEKTVPLEKLSINKKLGEIKSYSNPEALAHVYLAMQVQNTPKAFAVGDNIAYLQIKGGKAEQSHNVALLDDVKEKGLEVDYNYYWNKQIQPPLQAVLDVIDLDFSRQILAQANAYRTGQQCLTGFIKRKLESSDDVHRPLKKTRIVEKTALSTKQKKERAIQNMKTLNKFFLKDKN